MLAIFDLDGVLVDTAHIHTTALREAVKYATLCDVNDPMISNLLDASDGVRTVDKLRTLQTLLDLSDEDVKLIDDVKQNLTIDLMKKVPCNPDVLHTVKDLINRGYTTAVASNSRRKYVDILLRSAGLESYIAYSVAGDEVSKPKPDPEIFLKVMGHFKSHPDETLIFEDSLAGLTAAKLTGSEVVRVDPHTLLNRSCL